MVLFTNPNSESSSHYLVSGSNGWGYFPGYSLPKYSPTSTSPLLPNSPHPPPCTYPRPDSVPSQFPPYFVSLSPYIFRGKEAKLKDSERERSARRDSSPWLCDPRPNSLHTLCKMRRCPVFQEPWGILLSGERSGMPLQEESESHLFKAWLCALRPVT